MKKSENYLERIPSVCSGIAWKKDEKNTVTIEIENKGWVNKIAQKIFKKPRVSYIHLDEIGSFLWCLADGKENISNIARRAGEAFGEKAEPVYERTAKFFQILDSYTFIEWK